MKLYKIKHDYCYGDNKEVQRQKQIDSLTLVGLAGKEIDGGVVCTADQVLSLIKLDYCAEYDVKNCFDLVYSVESNFEQTVSTCPQKTVEISEDLFNNKCNSEQPSNLLMQIDETLLMEDACTDALQEKLSQGFRILAVCPQPQRRPDYVLGRKFIPKQAGRK